MDFLVDAQLPRRLAHRLRDVGHDVLHTLDLSGGNRTTDAEINDISIREDRVVVMEDADFVNSFLLSGEPRKLLLVSVGNASNADLEAILVPRLPEILKALCTYNYV